MPQPRAGGGRPRDDLQPLLDQELSRLPDKYRAADRPVRPGGQDPPGGGPPARLRRRDGGQPAGPGPGDAARAACPPRRGVSAGALAAVLSPEGAAAGVPASLVDSTIKAAGLCAAGQAAAGRGFRPGRRPDGRSAESHVADQAQDHRGRAPRRRDGGPGCGGPDGPDASLGTSGGPGRPAGPAGGLAPGEASGRRPRPGRQGRR